MLRTVAPNQEVAFADRRRHQPLRDNGRHDASRRQTGLSEGVDEAYEVVASNGMIHATVVPDL